MTKLKLIISCGYLFCWSYIAIKSWPNLSIYDVIDVLLMTWLNTENPFSGQQLFYDFIPW